MARRVGKYEIGRTLGEGTFGKVKIAVDTETGDKVAIKILEKDKIQKQRMGTQIKREISIMKMIRHSNVVNLLEVLASKTKIFIVLELVTGGELFDKIVAEGRLKEPEARFYFTQLINGVEYCHGQGICHRDLKPENLLLDDKLNLKISDFGLSNFYTAPVDESNPVLLHTTCGTPNYVAPEVLLDKGYDGKKADVWSMGVILYVLMAGYLPFDEENISDLFRKIQNAEYTMPRWFSKEGSDLVRCILNPDPEKRYTIPMIKEHPWMKKGPDYIPNVGDTGTSSKINESKMNESKSPDNKGHGVDEAITDITAEEKDENTHSITKLTGFDIVNAFTTNLLNKLITKNDAETFNRNTYIMSSKDPNSIIHILENVVNNTENLHFETISKDSYKYEIVVNGVKPINIPVQIYLISNELYMIEIRKGRGDIMEYYKIYQVLVQELQKAFHSDHMFSSQLSLI